MAEIIIKELSEAVIKKVDEVKRVIWHRISKEVPDRMGDVVRVGGMDAKDFKKKPTVLYGHMYAGIDPLPIIGRNIGFEVDGDELYAGTEFLHPERMPMSDKLRDLVNDCWNLNKAKLLGWSIGFIPVEKEQLPREEKDAPSDGLQPGWDFKRWKLLEYSNVIIPANQAAINDCISAGKVSKTIFDFAAAVLPRATQRDLRTAAEGNAGAASSDEPAPAADSTERNAPPDTAPYDYVKPFPNEHACRVADPDDFKKFRRGTRDHEGKEYSIIFGQKEGESSWAEQSYRYAVDVWKAAEAAAHCKAHEGTFEAAAAEEEAFICDECKARIKEKPIAGSQVVFSYSTDDIKKIKSLLTDIIEGQRALTGKVKKILGGK